MDSVLLGRINLQKVASTETVRILFSKLWGVRGVIYRVLGCREYGHVALSYNNLVYTVNAKTGYEIMGEKEYIELSPPITTITLPLKLPSYFSSTLHLMPLGKRVEIMRTIFCGMLRGPMEDPWNCVTSTRILLQNSGYYIPRSILRPHELKNYLEETYDGCIQDP